MIVRFELMLEPAAALDEPMVNLLQEAITDNLLKLAGPGSVVTIKRLEPAGPYPAGTPVLKFRRLRRSLGPVIWFGFFAAFLGLCFLLGHCKGARP